MRSVFALLGLAAIFAAGALASSAVAEIIGRAQPAGPVMTSLQPRLKATVGALATMATVVAAVAVLPVMSPTYTPVTTAVPTAPPPNSVALTLWQELKLKLNAWLTDQCVAYARRTRHPEFKDRTIFEMFEEERARLMPFLGPFAGRRVRLRFDVGSPGEKPGSAITGVGLVLRRLHLANDRPRRRQHLCAVWRRRRRRAAGARWAGAGTGELSPRRRRQRRHAAGPARLRQPASRHPRPITHRHRHR